MGCHGGLLLCVGEEVFVRLWGDYPWPAFEVEGFEELSGVLWGFFELVELGLCDGSGLGVGAHVVLEDGGLCAGEDHSVC